MNFFLSQKAEGENASVMRSLAVGVAASLLVPLFLNMISSNLVDGTKTDIYKLLVFAGFCLIASISSASFIRTLSDRVLSEARSARKEAKVAQEEATRAKKDVQEVQESITPILDRHTELDPPPTPVRSERPAQITESDRVLLGIRNSKYAYRTATGIAKDAGLDASRVNAVLQQLAETGLVSQKTGRKGNRLWFITQKGLDHASRDAS